MKAKFWIYVFSCLMLSGIDELMAQTISFSPTRIFFKGNPGETLSEVITVSNSGKSTYEFIVHLQDWKRDSLGNKVYAPMGTLPASNAKNIRLSETAIKLAPGEKRNFEVGITIPQEKEQGFGNCMLFFTQTNAQVTEPKGKAGIGVKMSLEFGIQLFSIADGLKNGDLNFLAFDYHPADVSGKGHGRLAVKFENTGEINKDGFLRFELTHKTTGAEIKAKPIPITIMPADFQWIYYLMPETLPEGEYLVVAILDAGDHHNLKVAEKNIYVKK